MDPNNFNLRYNGSLLISAINVFFPHTRYSYANISEYLKLHNLINY
jgi:hypothetical protein